MAKNEKLYTLTSFSSNFIFRRYLMKYSAIAFLLMFYQCTDQSEKVYEIEKSIKKNSAKLHETLSAQFLFFTFCECFNAFCDKCTAGLKKDKRMKFIFTKNCRRRQTMCSHVFIVFTKLSFFLAKHHFCLSLQRVTFSAQCAEHCCILFHQASSTKSKNIFTKRKFVDTTRC